MEYDDLLRFVVGEMGRFQKLVLLLVCLIAIPGAFNNMTIVFLAAVSDHFCHSPSAAHLNLTWDQEVALTTTPDKSKCWRYQRIYTGMAKIILLLCLALKVLTKETILIYYVPLYHST